MRSASVPPRFALLLAAAAVFGSCGRSPTAPPPPPLVIVTTTLPGAEVGEPYAEALHGEGGTGAYQWDIVAGMLPPGLVLTVDDLSVKDGLITGTPLEAVSATFTVRLRSADGQSTSREYSLVVEGPPPPLTLVPRVPPGLVGGPYSVALSPTPAGQRTWSVIAGRLPAGLALTQAGRIQGTPEVAETTTFTIEVRAGEQVAQQQYQLQVVPHNTAAFKITVFALTSVPSSVQAHVDAAVARLEAAVTGNLSAIAIPETFFGPNHCSGFGSLVNGTSVDDMLIILNIMPIDGPGRVLGRAGPCGIRDSNIPFVGAMVLDIDDLVPLTGTETLTDILTHEMAHVLGFGTMWDHVGLLQGTGTADPRFTGQRAVAEFQALGGTGAVPLETQGGEGTAESHWRKTTFRTELMTGFAEPVGVSQPLSRVTIGSLADLGYTVNMAAADPFLLGATMMAAPGGDWRDALGHDHVLRGPILKLRRDGTTIELEAR